MAAPRAPRRPTLLLSLAVLAGLLPTSVLPAGPAEADTQPILQVSPEIGIASGSLAPLTATVFGARSATTVTFRVVDGPAAGAADQVCNVPASTDPESSFSCPPVEIRSTQAGSSLVRVWVGSSPDMDEGRLSDGRPTPSGGILGGLTADSAADCQPEDDPNGGTLLGGSTTDICHTAKNPATNQPDSVAPGGTAEGDGTDVVRVTWTTFNEGRLDCEDAHPADGTDVQYKNAQLADQQERYDCQLTTSDGAPVSGAHVDYKVLSGPDAKADTDTPDVNNACETGSDGRCTAPIDVTMTGKGANVICFWAEPASDMQDGTDHDNTYGSASTTDGRDCSQLKADSPLRNDLTDVVYLDYDDPRPEGLDVQPETNLVSGATRFSLRSIVYDQFGRPLSGNTTLQAKLFQGSVLAAGGDNNMSSLDPSLTCTTGGSESCSILTPPQNELGTNLACVWISAPVSKAPTLMTGAADQDSSTCTARQESWQAVAEQEARFDPTKDEDVPVPPTDGLDVVRFAVQSRPKISTVTPTDRRQDISGDVIAVDGINFLPSAQITISGSGVTLGPTAVVSSIRLEASLAVAPDAPPGPRDVTVTNRSDGGSVTCSGCFRVVGQGYWMVASDGGIFSFGDAQFAGSAGNVNLAKPIVAMAPTPSGLGYWMVASDGGLFNYGDAPFVGSAGNLNLSKPIVAMAATPSGRGYWLVSSDGGVFNYGDARFFGATSLLTLSKPIVSIVATPSGRGYWLVASDGGIFAFGDARFFGSTGDLVLNKPIVAMTPTRTGRGYWLVASDGGIFAYGDATFYGSTGDIPLNQPIVGMTTTPLGKGYWMVASDGGIFSFGDARFYGSTGNIKLNRPIVGLARR